MIVLEITGAGIVKRNSKLIFSSIILIFLAIVITVAVIFKFVFFDSCSSISSRFISPDDNYEIVINEKDCGATTSRTVSVYVVEKGRKVGYFDNIILLANKYEALKIKWKNNREIEIIFNKARIYEFRNWRILKKGKNYHDISINLIVGNCVPESQNIN